MTWRSLHLDVLSQIGRNIQIFAFDDGWLTFFKSSAGNRLELQNFLFRLYRFVGWRFFFLLRGHFLLWRHCERLVFPWNGWGGGCRLPRHLHEHVCDVCQHPATIHQWIFKRLRESVVRAIVRISFAEAKQATAVAYAQCRQQIIEADANKSRPLN